MGLMLAWLQAAADFPDAHEHKAHKPLPSREARLAARTAFADEEDAQVWFDCERPVRDGEDDEPAVVP